VVSENSNSNLNHHLKLEIVTPEQSFFSNFVDYISVPGVDGEMGILPHHCPLITMLQAGELRIRKGDEEFCLAVGGGFLEVRPDRVIILADMVERDELINVQKAEEAIRQARESLSNSKGSIIDKAEAEAALRFELAQIRLAEKQKNKKKKII
jgi:F-type H+-transporting ATPase subunit epsilon